VLSAPGSITKSGQPYPGWHGHQTPPRRFARGLPKMSESAPSIQADHEHADECRRRRTWKSTRRRRSNSCPPCRRLQIVRNLPPVPACVGGRLVDGSERVALLWKARRPPTAGGVFFATRARDDGRCCPGRDPPTTALFRALQSGEARIEVIMGDSVARNPTRQQVRLFRRLTR